MAVDCRAAGPALPDLQIVREMLNQDVCKICKNNGTLFESPTSVLLSAFSHLTGV